MTQTEAETGHVTYECYDGGAAANMPRSSSAELTKVPQFGNALQRVVESFCETCVQDCFHLLRVRLVAYFEDVCR